MVRFDFEFEPGGDGNYCLLPVCQLNGYWLAWTWGTCDQDPSVSTAHVEVEKSVQVFQMIDDIQLPLALAIGGPPVYSATHQVVDQTNQGGGASQSGFSFNGIPAFGVDLLARISHT